MADEHTTLACEAIHEAQRNVAKAQEVVDRYEAKLREIEERSDFDADNGLYSNFIDRLRDARESLRQREDSLKECRGHLNDLNMKNSKTMSNVGNHTEPDFLVSQQFEDAKKYLFDKIDHLSSVIDQAVTMKEQLHSMKSEIEKFVFVESKNGTMAGESFHSPAFLQSTGEVTTNYSSMGEVIETGLGYRMHIYNRKMHRVPEDWRIPRCSTRELWRQWWIGDKEKQVPPLRFLVTQDVSHLDKVPVLESEMKGRKGRYSRNRRKSSKILSDMRFLMGHITSMVEEAGAMEHQITPAAVNRMFSAVAHRLILTEKDERNMWNTLVKQVRINQSMMSKDLANSAAPKVSENEQDSIVVDK